MRNRRGKLTVLGLAGAAAIFAQSTARTLDVPFVPTSQQLVVEMLKLANVTEADTVVDLNPERIKEANENARRAGVTDKVKFIEDDLFSAEIRPATVATLYLLPGVNVKLRPRLLSELKPGTRVVSHSFDMGDWKPDKQVDAEGGRLYLWVIPKPPEIGK
jgi:hypothetical protein